MCCSLRWSQSEASPGCRCVAGAPIRRCFAVCASSSTSGRELPAAACEDVACGAPVCIAGAGASGIDAGSADGAVGGIGVGGIGVGAAAGGRAVLGCVRPRARKPSRRDAVSMHVFSNGHSARCIILTTVFRWLDS
eukprot:1166114-Pleurochrysis_carterae.AAC.1